MWSCPKHLKSLERYNFSVLRRVLNLFRRYVTRHARMQKPGFPLLDSNGKRFGYVDRISLREGHIWVEGWTLKGPVGLANVKQVIECTPSLPREDVTTAFEDARGKTPGFLLDIPVSSGNTVFWADVQGARYIHALPKIQLGHLHWAQIIPFLRDVVPVIPAGLYWLVHRDTRSAARIKSALGLNNVARSGRLNTLLFSDVVVTKDDPSTSLTQTTVTIVLPVYNAFDLLPEVLARVLKHTDLPWRLIVIEDCSSDHQVRPWLRDWRERLDAETAARVIILENETNLGFIHSVNRAFAAALPFGDHVVLLNSDAFVPAGWASRLFRPMLEHDNVATVTPMANDAEIFSIPTICQRAQLLPGEADAIDRTAALFFPGTDIADAPTGVGFCMAMNINFLRKFPKLDTRFGRGYGEEVDWCQQVLHRGGRHLGLGGLFVEHRGGTSFGSVEKLKLIQKNSQTISRRYPRYDAEVQDFIREDPLNTPRLALSLAWAGIRQKGAVPVYIAHDMGGGAEHYLQARLKSDLDTGDAAVVLRVGGRSHWQIELHSIHGITRGETDSIEFVSRLLALLPARNIVYSCAVGGHDLLSLPKTLVSLASSQNDWIEVLIHDYLVLSPSYTLLGSDGFYHGLPQSDSNSDPAHIGRRSDGTGISLAEWRESWGTLMEAAERVTVFSKSSRELIAEAYPQISDRITLTPHRLLHDIPHLNPGQRNDDLPVIGVLGNIGYPKGASVLRDLSKVLADSGQARLVVLGNVDPGYRLTPPAHIHGTYDVAEISSLVVQYGITSWLIPSLCPETFSYTTHEAIATGLPVWGFDLGAQADAIGEAAATTGRGGVIPLHDGVPEIEQLIVSIIGSEPGAATMAINKQKALVI